MPNSDVEPEVGFCGARLSRVSSPVDHDDNTGSLRRGRLLSSDTPPWDHLTASTVPSHPSSSTKARHFAQPSTDPTTFSSELLPLEPTDSTKAVYESKSMSERSLETSSSSFHDVPDRTESGFRESVVHAMASHLPEQSNGEQELQDDQELQEMLPATVDEVRLILQELSADSGKLEAVDCLTSG